MNTFIVPTLDDTKTLIQGNYIAIKRTGYYNCNKTSWHVMRVNWIVGDFPVDDNTDLDFTTNLAATLPTCKDSSVTLTTRGNYAYFVAEHMGDMSKAEARALIKKWHTLDGGITVSYECICGDINTAIKHTTRQISLVNANDPR